MNLDSLTPREAVERLTHCCGARRWVDAVVKGRPYLSTPRLLAAVEQAFDAMTREDWLEAFRHHPKIGDVDSLRKKFASTAHLAGKEQAGVAAASEATLSALAEGNSVYEAKFGFIFIVCATGKSAAEMLEILNARLPNPPEKELGIAAVEQRKITRLRLEKSFGGP